MRKKERKIDMRKTRILSVLLGNDARCTPACKLRHTDRRW